MFDYNLIDAIDPKYLEQFLDPKQTGAAAFKCPGDCEKTIEHEGRTYRVKFEMDDELELVWNDYAYDLVGSWKGVDENSRMVSVLLHDPRIMREYAMSEKNLLEELQARTYCYDWNDVSFFDEKKGEWRRNESGVFELSHEQVRQRVLCFIAMCAQVQQEAKLKKIIDLLPSSPSGIPVNGRFEVIAHLAVAAHDIYHFILRVTVEAYTYIKISMSHTSKLKKEPEGMNDLFEMPLLPEKLPELQERNKVIAAAGKTAAEERAKQELKTMAEAETNEKQRLEEKERKKAERKAAKKAEQEAAERAAHSLHISYESIDTELSPEACLSAMTTETKGKRKLVCEANKELAVAVGQKQIHVKCTVATSLSRLWKAYTENIEPDWEDEEEACYYDLETAVKAAGEGIDPNSGEFAKGLENGVPEGVPALSQEQVRRRCLWFLHACCVCTTDAALQRIAELAPKKKDGGLYKKRILRIATLTYTEDGQAAQLIAQNMSDTELAVKVRKVVPDKAEMNEMSEDVAMTTDLFDFVK